MTQTDKELLLKDLCSRLPYGVKVQDIYYNSLEPAPIWLIDINAQNVRMFADEGYQSIEYIKPYLFPMSKVVEEIVTTSNKHIAVNVDFFHKNHIDYRGLIPKGLAIDATGLNIY
jgi:hypothetical protein